MITLEEAVTQLKAFRAMVEACSVPQVKIEMRNRWGEWRKCVAQLKELGDEYAIALFCETVPGQWIFFEDAGSDTARIVRKLVRDGQASLHIGTRMGRDAYTNLAGELSPVIVLDIPITIPADVPDMPDEDES